MGNNKNSTLNLSSSKMVPSSLRTPFRSASCKSIKDGRTSFQPMADSSRKSRRSNFMNQDIDVCFFPG